jgi:aminopeptidase N
MLHEQKGAQQEEVLAMSFYPNEAEPIWSHYSTHAVIHTMDVYSRFTFDYPYPTAQSVNTWKRGGMEYPMISFNGYRPTEPGEDDDYDEDDDEDDDEDEQSDSMQDGKPTYSRSIKYGLIGVVIHEVGHNYFPMIVNSDERRWTWMDEGLNSFLEYLAELEWEEGFPAYSDKSNVLDYIPDYMTSENQVPIMTQSDSILQFGPNAYSKPTAALTVLRETVMGRESFDFAFREYAERWKFKRPTPADFFRTMEDASGVDLDWFWQGWFYTTDHVDIAITDVREYRVKTKDPELDFPADRNEKNKKNPVPIMQDRNRDEGIKTRLERYPGLSDLYNENDAFTVSNKDRNAYRKYLKKLKDWERKALDRIVSEQPFIYFVDFTNIGGLVSPIPLVMHYEDGSSRELMIPAEIWRRNASKVTRLFIEDRAIKSLSVDDRHQTAEANFADNSFPPKITPSRLELYKSKYKSRNLMADLLVELKGKHKGDALSDEKEVPLEPVKP